jgi:hypothetical protein
MAVVRNPQQLQQQHAILPALQAASPAGLKLQHLDATLPPSLPVAVVCTPSSSSNSSSSISGSLLAFLSSRLPHLLLQHYLILDLAISHTSSTLLCCCHTTAAAAPAIAAAAGKPPSLPASSFTPCYCGPHPQQQPQQCPQQSVSFS